MSSRFPTQFHVNTCYHPVRISKNGITYYVPCGKCNGCLLNKANSWSFRLGDEIENSSHSIFFTLTYDNFHVPKMQCFKHDDLFYWCSAPNNYRFNGNIDVLRDPVDFYSPYNLHAPIKNYFDENVIAVCDKRDIQLWLKLLRKSIYEKFNIPSGSFRYYIISEYGPGKDANHGKYRPHYHGIIFPASKEIADALMHGMLFESWKMCDKGLFEQYTKYCDSGTRHYVTEYITGSTFLPSLLREQKEVQPFRLVSKQNGIIGSNHLVRSEVSKNIERGIDEYSKRISRIERNYIFCYPKALTNSLFPKCGRYSLLSFNGLLRIYEYLYNVRAVGIEISSVFAGFSELSIQDYSASKACLKVCDMLHWTPYHYVEVLDEFYYRKAQSALRYQYDFQQQNIDNPYLCLSWYFNLLDYLNDSDSNENYPLSSERFNDSRRWFLSSFGISVFDYNAYLAACDNSDYVKECDDIIENADKSKKVNSLVGISPDIV